MKAVPIAGVIALLASCGAPPHYRVLEQEYDAYREKREQRDQSNQAVLSDLEARVRAREAALADLERSARVNSTGIQNIEAALATPGTCQSAGAPSEPPSKPSPVVSETSTVHHVPVDAGEPSRGPLDAPVTAVLFIDLQSPSAPRLRGIAEQLVRDYADKLRLVYKPMTLQAYWRDAAAAEAALCAHRQGAFWPYFDQLFDHQSPDVDGFYPEDEDLERYARAVGIDFGKWKACVSSEATQGLVSESDKLAEKLNLRVPMIVINGRKPAEARRYIDFARIVDEELAKASGQSPPAFVELESVVRTFVVDAKTPRRGPSDAKLELVVFFDFRSFPSLRFAKVLRRLELRYEGKIAIVYKHFPRARDTDSREVALAAVCVHEQGRLWDFEAMLEPRPMAIGTHEIPNIVNRVRVQDTPFEACRGSNYARTVVDRDVAEGDAIGVRDTPTVFINGRRFHSRSDHHTFEELSAVIDTQVLVEGSK